MSENENDFLINPEDVDGDSNLGKSNFIQPNIEVELSVKKRKQCRDIVCEINRYGMSQRQLVYLIYLLSLNLENRDLMVYITSKIGEERNKVPLTSNDTESNKSKIILDLE